MAPCGEVLDKTCKNKSSCTGHPRISMESLQRTISDISWDLIKQEEKDDDNDDQVPPFIADHLPPIPEVEDAKCECCGLSEECTQDYIKRVRDRFSGRLICGLCAEAVDREMEKNGGKREEALREHMNACLSFNRLGRAYPVLCQAEAMREILKKSREKSLSPRIKTPQKKGGGKIARSSSCMPALSKEIKNGEMVN